MNLVEYNKMVVKIKIKNYLKLAPKLIENGEKHDENERLELLILLLVWCAAVVLLDLNNLFIKTLLLFKKSLDLSLIVLGDEECLKLFAV